MRDRPCPLQRGHCTSPRATRTDASGSRGLTRKSEKTTHEQVRKVDGRTALAKRKRATRLTLHILAAVAEHEREMIAERTKAALQAAKARGIRLGRNGADRASVSHQQEIRLFDPVLSENHIRTY